MKKYILELTPNTRICNLIRYVQDLLKAPSWTDNITQHQECFVEISLLVFSRISLVHQVFKFSISSLVLVSYWSFPPFYSVHSSECVTETPVLLLLDFITSYNVSILFYDSCPPSLLSSLLLLYIYLHYL